jgi:hypothetical protein
MPLFLAAAVLVTDRERRHLESVVRQQTCPQQLAVRARIILLAGRGAAVRPTARRARYRPFHGPSVAAAVGGPETPGTSVAGRLADAARPDVRATFTAQQVYAIIALFAIPPSHRFSLYPQT